MDRISSTQLILIAEDSDDDYEATVRAFKTTGNLKNPVHRCEDGQETLDYLFREGQYEDPSSSPRPGIILLDLNMPGVDGRDVLKRVKANEDVRDIPIVVLTTSDDQKDIDSCYQAGANTYIHKPVDLDGFFEAIKRLTEYWFEIAILPKKDN